MGDMRGGVGTFGWGESGADGVLEEGGRAGEGGEGRGLEKVVEGLEICYGDGAYPSRTACGLMETLYEQTGRSDVLNGHSLDK